MAEGKTKSQPSLPVAGRRFYIDEVDVPKGKLKKLERYLLLLGAKLDKFFTKDIFCLITDHAPPADYKVCSKSADGVCVSTPSPFAPTPSSNTGAPSETSTTNPKASTSRAALMLTKSKEQNNRHGSLTTASASELLVRNAKQWSIKMLATDVALRWMEQKIVSLGIHKKKRKPPERPERAPRHGGKALRAPYVKIEDKSMSYRPIYRQLTSDAVPVLNTDAEHCPFETKGAPSALPPQVAAATQEPSDNADTTLNTSRLEVVDKIDKERQPSAKGMAGGNGKTSQSKQQAQKNKVDKKLTFCMVCKVRFENLEQHLRSDEHTKFAEDDTNYAQVDALVNTSASMRRFLDDIIKYHSVHQQEGLAQQKEMVIESMAPGVPLMPALTSAPASIDDANDSLDNMMHRSVSDSQGSAESLTELPLGGHQSPLSLQRIEVDAEAEEASPPQTADSASMPAAVVANQETPNISRVIVDAKKSKIDSMKTVTAAQQPVHIDTSSVASTHLSPSEIVKLRKRGVNKTTSRNSPKKKSPVKRQSKDKKRQKKPKNLADVQAHWALLSDKKYDSCQDASHLPMDVSYAALNDSQLQVMASQRETVGAMDEDDKSLVHSIHSMLHEVTFKASSVSSSCDDADDPLLSCDSFIKHKLAHTQQNDMLKPTTPRKSPRVSLGARDWPDEHFSPQKQRLSMSMEKARRLSESQQRLCKKVSKLNFDRPLSTRPSSPTEDKENISSPSPVEAHSIQLDAAQEDANISCVSVVNTDDSLSKRKVLMSPNIANDDLHGTPLHISTPTPEKSSSKAIDNVVNSTPVTSSTKKSLFNSPQLHRKVRTPHQSKRSRKPSVNFRRGSTTSKDYSDCFGFEESDANSQPHTPTQMNSCTPASKSSSLRHTKFDYDRQNSLLSFGSISLSQYDDVFSQPPDIQQIIEESESVENHRKQPKASNRSNDYCIFSDSDLSSPGFKVSSKMRKEAANARRIHKAGETPGRKRAAETLKSSPTASRQSARLRGFSPVVTDCTANPNNNNNKRNRTIKSGNLSKKAKQNFTQATADGITLPQSTSTSPDITDRTSRSIKRRDIFSNTCKSIAEDPLDVMNSKESSFAESCRSESPTSFYRSLPDYTRDSLIKHKYNYSVRSNASSSSCVEKTQKSAL